MAAPMTFEIPHKLGREEARRRIEAGIPKMERHIPGGGQVKANWTGNDKVRLTVSAMGQTIDADLAIEETFVRASVQVPLMLSMMASTISGFVRTSAEKMLAPPSGDKD